MKPLKPYTVMLSWTIYGKRRPVYKEKTLRKVMAESITDAKETAIHIIKTTKHVTPHINCIWYD